jgi:hypothetical protein
MLKSLAKSRSTGPPPCPFIGLVSSCRAQRPLLVLTCTGGSTNNMAQKEGNVRVLTKNTKIENLAKICNRVARLTLVGFCLLASGGLFASAVSAQASNVYVTPDGGGNGVCTNNTHPPSWFNNSANWGTSTTQIGPGTIVHLCGTISASLAFHGSGTSGNPITLLFENGAKLSQTFCGSDGAAACLSFSGRSWLVIDGGTDCGTTVLESNCNGVIEATANGTGANQSGNSAVIADFSDHVEVKNLDIRNIYVRKSTSDGFGGSNGDKPYAVQMDTVTNFRIHHSKAHDMNWAVTMVACGAGQTHDIEVDHMDLYNINHGVTDGVCAQNGNRILIHDNHFGAEANWDQPVGNGFHHDGIHVYQVAGGVLTNILIYNNLFDGDWGKQNTAFVYTEGTAFTMYLWNNVGVIQDGLNMNNGAWTTTVGPSGTSKLWNNTVYAGANQTSYVSKTEGVTDYRNNVVVAPNTGGNLFNLVVGQTSQFFDYNIWQNSNGQPFYNGSTFVDYATFKGELREGSGQDSHGQLVANAGINPNGTLVAGRVTALATGTNLTSLCAGDFVSLCKDTSNGGQRAVTTARPASGPWNAGAFSSGGATSSAPDPPGGLSVIVK